MLNLKNIDATWTLFLDRDGVINDEKPGEYVLHRDHFIFSKGVLDVFKKLSDAFGRIIIVTNQKGVGKGLMSQQNLDEIHADMQQKVITAGGRIDKIYACIDLDDANINRKPNHGMAVQAGREFPEIDFTKSIIVGNKPSDMQFGRRAGMHTVFVATTNPAEPFPHPDIDLRFNSLSQFAAAL